MHITECFTSFQGEGGSTGTPATFLRLYGCNMECTYCDEKQDPTDYKNVNVEEVIQLIKTELNKLPSYKLLIITGGEPFLQYKELKELITKLHYKYPSLKIHIETNGTIQKFLLVDKIVVSPKQLDYNNLKECVTYFQNKYKQTVEFKFVVTEENIDNIISFINKHFIDNLYLQPETSNAQTITSLIIQKYKQIRTPFRISTQTHKYLKQK